MRQRAGIRERYIRRTYAHTMRGHDRFAMHERPKFCGLEPFVSGVPHRRVGRRVRHTHEVNYVHAGKADAPGTKKKVLALANPVLSLRKQRAGLAGRDHFDGNRAWPRHFSSRAKFRPYPPARWRSRRCRRSSNGMISRCISISSQCWARVFYGGGAGVRRSGAGGVCDFVSDAPARRDSAGGLWRSARGGAER